MSKEKVFIVLSHKHSIGKATKGQEAQWETTETVEFVNQLRKKHLSMSSVVADYINRKIIIGSNTGISDYNQLEAYIEKKYSKQLLELDSAYKALQVKVDIPVVNNTIVDSFGNTRSKTVFDIS